MIILLKSRCFLLIIAVLSLQGCVTGNGLKTSKVNALEKNKIAATYNAQLGLIYLKQGDRQRAKHKLLMALEQAPNADAVNAAMAYFMEQTGEYNSAEFYYKKALLFAQESGGQLNNYGAFLCRRGKYKEAESYFLKAVKDNQYVNTAAAYENAGLCAITSANYTKAKQYFIKALNQDPSREQSLYELVRLEKAENHFHQALTYLEKYTRPLLDNKALLKLGAELAEKTGEIDLSKRYQKRLNNLAITKLV